MGLTRAAMSDHGVSAKMQLAEGLPHILGDRVQLQQVILNLIMNAIEAMSEVSEGSRELLISTSEVESDGVLVAVSDTGPGLPQANPERIFEAFYTTKPERLGDGIVDLPLDRRSAWRAALGNTERTSRRCLLHDAADRGTTAWEPGAQRLVSSRYPGGSLPRGCGRGSEVAWTLGMGTAQSVPRSGRLYRGVATGSKARTRVELSSGLSANDERQISLAYLPPTPRQTWSALAGAAILLLGLAAVAPFAAEPLPHANGFIPALDAIIFVTDLITASLLFAHFSITRSRALLALACGYLFSAAIVVAHALSFPGAFSSTGNLGGSNQTTLWLYMLWHLGFPAALFAYVWLRDRDRARAGARTRTALVIICSVAGVLAAVSCIVWLAAAGLLPYSRARVEDCGPIAPWLKCGPIAPWLVALTISICVAALGVLWAFRRSALDQWLMVVVLASIVEVVTTAQFGGLPFSLGFYTGRVFSLVTSTVILTALLAETTRLYSRLARANMLASILSASQALSSEIVLPKLVERLMTIAIENAGADRGLLILPSGDEYLIRAEARATGDHAEVAMRQEPITEITCPESIVRHVIRTRESVILHDASKPNLFARDDYLRDRQSKSVLCLPLIKQRELAGILLLENTLTSHAFTPARIAILELLAAQAAISLENTRLYGAVQEREAKVRRLVDSNIIGICIFDLDRRIMEANDAFLSIVGYGRDDVISGRLSFTGLTPPEWAGTDERLLAELASTGTWRPAEKDFFRKDGSRVPVLVGGATFGELRHQGVAFVVDLSERKRAEAELAHANRVATMGQLTASIAHEVNQPIAALLTNAETAVRWLARQPPDLEKTRQSIDRVINDGKRAADIVSRIRDFSKKAPARKERLEINEAILEIIGLARVPMSDSGVLAKMQLAEGLPLILGDRVQLQQVILNLIMNAIEAMSEVGEGSRELSISTERVRVGRRACRGKRYRPGSVSSGPRAHLRGVLHNQTRRLGYGIVNLPLDRRSAWRAALGYTERTSRRCLLLDVADRGFRLGPASALRTGFQNSAGRTHVRRERAPDFSLDNQPTPHWASNERLQSDASCLLHFTGEFIVTYRPRLTNGGRKIFPQRLFEKSRAALPVVRHSRPARPHTQHDGRQDHGSKARSDPARANCKRP